MVVPVLTGRSIRLRPPVPVDVEERLALGQAPEILRMFGADPADIAPLTRSGAAAFIDGLARHPAAWVIDHQDRFLGEIPLDDIDRHDRRARLAVGLYDPEKLGKGIGREAIQLVLRHAFEMLHLHRVGLRVISFNVRAIRAYTACGFVEEGREREAAFVAGAWHDDVIMGILAGDKATMARVERSAGWPGQARP
jgi:RimJ/RimL family protein N-acetyltransferase